MEVVFCSREWPAGAWRRVGGAWNRDSGSFRLSAEGSCQDGSAVPAEISAPASLPCTSAAGSRGRDADEDKAR